MDGRYGGYINYTEWKQKDPESYWKYIDGMMEKYEKDTTIDLTPVIKVIESTPIPPDNKFSEQIGRAIRGELTTEELAICNEDFVKKEPVKLKWYQKIWNWIKGLFSGGKNTVPTHAERGVFSNKEFDIKEWIIEQNDKVNHAIDKDAQGKKDVEGVIVCPVCFKKRKYYVAPNGHARTSCEGCSVSTLQ